MAVITLPGMLFAPGQAIQTKAATPYMKKVFTGLNHLNMISVLDKKYSEHFGFTESEVLRMLE